MRITHAPALCWLASVGECLHPRPPSSSSAQLCVCWASRDSLRGGAVAFLCHSAPRGVSSRAWPVPATSGLCFVCDLLPVMHPRRRWQENECRTRPAESEGWRRCPRVSPASLHRRALRSKMSRFGGRAIFVMGACAGAARREQRQRNAVGDSTRTQQKGGRQEAERMERNDSDNRTARLTAARRRLRRPRESGSA